MKMNKYLMLSILFTVVAGMTISPIMADNLGATTYKTPKLTWTGKGECAWHFDYNIDKTNSIFGVRFPPCCGSFVGIYIGSGNKYKLTKADVTIYNPKNDYKPDYAYVYYQKK